MTVKVLTSLDSEAMKRFLRNFVVQNIPSNVLSDPDKSSVGNALLSISAFPISEILVSHLNFQIQESNLETARQRFIVEMLARNNAYNVHNADAAEVILSFTGTSQFSIPKGFKVSSSSGGNTPLIFSTTENGISSFNGTNWVLNLNAINAEFKTENGTTTGVEDFEITLQSTPVVIDNDFLTSGVIVNGLTYTGLSNRINAGPTSRTYTYFHNKDNNLILRFGDNKFGAAVPDNAPWAITYKVGGGLIGNVTPGSITTLEDTTAGLTSVTNNQAATGGNDQENLDEIRVNAVANILVREAALTATDYERIAVEVNGIGKARAIKDIGSTQPPLINLYLTSEGTSFGTPDVAKLAEVEDYFFDKSVLGTTMKAYPATQQQCKVVVDIALESGTNQNEAQNAVENNILNLLYYPTTNFGTTLLVSDINDAANINGVQGPNILECRIIPEIVPASTNEGNPTNPSGVFVRTNSEVALNLIQATGATTFTVTKKIPKMASILAIDSVKDTTNDYTELIGTSTSINVKSIDGFNRVNNTNLGLLTNQYQNYLLVDSNENVFVINSSNATSFTLANNALNHGVGNFDVSAGAYKIVRNFRNKTIEKSGNTRNIIYNTENQFFIDNGLEGDLTLIMAKNDAFFIEIPNGSGSTGTFFESLDKDYAFTLVAGITPLRATPPADTFTFITSEFAGDVIYKRDSDLLTLTSDNVLVKSHYRKEK